TFINHKFIVLSHKVAPMIKKYFNTQNSALSPNTLNSSLRIASHNVNGLNSKGKQLSLVQSMNHKHLDILGICDTRLIQKNANFACNSDNPSLSIFLDTQVTFECIWRSRFHRSRTI